MKNISKSHRATMAIFGALPSAATVNAQIDGGTTTVDLRVTESTKLALSRITWQR